MYTKRLIDPKLVLFFSTRILALTGVLSTGVYFAYHAGAKSISLPFLPIATVGTAVAFYVGFKNNASYDRLWEARKIWGNITNTSRAIASYLLAVSGDRIPLDAARLFVHRQIAYVNVLRLQLRRKNLWDDRDDYTRLSKRFFNNQNFETDLPIVLGEFATSDLSPKLLSSSNPAVDLLHLQMQSLKQFKSEGWIDVNEASDLMRMVNDVFAHQGSAERIKSFPFPRQYAFFSETFVYIFMALLPFGLVGEFGKLSVDREWLVIPFSMLISWVFFTMEKVGDTSENPFEASLNDVPMTAICRNIEIDLRRMVGESDLPSPIAPVDNVLL